MTRRLSPALWAVLCFVLIVTRASAHVGSKDVFQQMNAGPYRLYVTVRPPDVIPGVAVVEVRSSGAAVKAIRITPVPMVGEASKHPPTSDALKQSAADPAFFSGSVWLMATGSWKVNLLADGAAGRAQAAVPVPAEALGVLHMDRSMGLLLGGLGVLLALGVAGIVTGAVGESRLAPGTEPAPSKKRAGLIAGAVTLAVVVLAVWLGGKWWNVEASDYAADVFHPLSLKPGLHGGVVDLRIGEDPTEIVRRRRSNTDLLLDHGHPMHLYAIREPGMDAVYHLHPALAAPGDLRMNLPAMLPGHYRLFADIVHRSGLPETLTSTLDIPEGFRGGTLDPEDASAVPPPLAAGELGPKSMLPDGYDMVWDKPADLRTGQAEVFRFHLLDPSGQPAGDVVPYLGMAGHAAFVKTDWSVFAHTHPEGSAPMPSVMVANGAEVPMAMPAMPTEKLSPAVEFPYGFPSAGRYRIFVQMKHGTTVETGVFDADVK